VGAGLGAVVLLGPVVHPWYLLWAAVPLAATRGLPRYRRAALAASAVLAVMVPPTGADFNFRAYQLPMAIVAGIVLLGAAVLLVRRTALQERTSTGGTGAGSGSRAL
jgi:alpha-1,6-mannosyltransferase